MDRRGAWGEEGSATNPIWTPKRYHKRTRTRKYFGLVDSRRCTYTGRGTYKRAVTFSDTIYSYCSSIRIGISFSNRSVYYENVFGDKANSLIYNFELIIRYIIDHAKAILMNES